MVAEADVTSEPVVDVNQREEHADYWEIISRINPWVDNGPNKLENGASKLENGPDKMSTLQIKAIYFTMLYIYI